MEWVEAMESVGAVLVKFRDDDESISNSGLVRKASSGKGLIDVRCRPHARYLTLC